MAQKRKARLTPTNDQSSEDWDKKKVRELVAECVKRGIDTNGKKAELVKRLKGEKQSFYYDCL